MFTYVMYKLTKNYSYGNVIHYILTVICDVIIIVGLIHKIW